MKDLFGREVTMEEARALARKRPPSARREMVILRQARGVHPHNGFPLKGSETCGSCKHCIARQFAKTYHKCDLGRMTQGVGNGHPHALARLHEVGGSVIRFTVLGNPLSQNRDLRSWSVEKFMASIDVGECWLWTKGKTACGYGRIGRRTYAHRVAYELWVEPIPAGLWVLHRCDTPSCVRPEHLFLGDQKANMLDCARKERTASRKLTGAQVAQIRELWASGGFYQRELGERFGISQVQVSHIVRGKHWVAP